MDKTVNSIPPSLVSQRRFPIVTITLSKPKTRNYSCFFQAAFALYPAHPAPKAMSTSNPSPMGALPPDDSLLPDECRPGVPGAWADTSILKKNVSVSRTSALQMKFFIVRILLKPITPAEFTALATTSCYYCKAINYILIFIIYS